MTSASSQTKRALLTLAGTVLALLGSPGIVLAQSQTYSNNSAVYFLDNTGAMSKSMFVFGDASNRLNLGANNQIQVTITPTGNIGFGTANPQARLEIGTGNQIIGNGGAIYFRDQTGALNNSMFVFGDKANRLNLGAGNATQMTITPLGNVGIGTTNPQDRLELATGNQIIRNGGAIYFRDQTGTLGNSMFVFGDPMNRLNLGTGNATRMAITSTGNVGIGTTAPAAMLHVVGNVQVDGNIAAKYQDVAEWVKAQHNPPPGTVVVIDPSTPNSVVAASRPYDTSVAGVVSERPGLVLGEEAADRVKVAHTGRVKVKVDAQYGAIAIGDLIVTSPTVGSAMRSTPVDIGGTSVHRPGTLVGKALESLPAGEGEILVLLMLQ